MKVIAKYKISSSHDGLKYRLKLRIKYKITSDIFNSRLSYDLDDDFINRFEGCENIKTLTYSDMFKLILDKFQEIGMENVIKQLIKQHLEKGNNSRLHNKRQEELVKQLVSNWNSVEFEIQ